MFIRFSEMEEEILPQFKGGEKEYRVKRYMDENNTIMAGRLVPGASIGMHKHETNCEIIFITEGCGKVLYDGGEERVEAGACHYCPKGQAHSLINDSDADLLFYAVVAAQ
jgi:quercetin dioxygenase-like cupin family protein